MAPYYRGITFIENHAAPSTDYTARRILVLAPHGDYMQPDLTLIQAAQMLVAQVPTGNNGWGLTTATKARPWTAPWPFWPPRQ